MLRDDCCLKILRKNADAPHSSHHGYDDIERPSRELFQPFILLRRNSVLSAHRENPIQDIVDSDGQNAFVNKLRMEELAAERSALNCAGLASRQLVHTR